MPKYRYQCDCGVQFDGRNPIAKHNNPKKCPDCGGNADRMMPAGIEGHFNKEVTGVGPQNTGIHDLDTHIDRVIGQSAKQGMDVIERRQREKREFIERNKIDPKQVSRLPDGTYGTNTVTEQAFAERANRINSRAMTHFAKKRALAKQ